MKMSCTGGCSRLSTRFGLRHRSTIVWQWQMSCCGAIGTRVGRGGPGGWIAGSMAPARLRWGRALFHLHGFELKPGKKTGRTSDAARGRDAGGRVEAIGRVGSA